MSSCPQPHCKREATLTSLTPLRAVDNALQSVRGSTPSERSSAAATQEKMLTFYSRKHPGVRARYLERLKRFGLPISGSLDALASRDKELVIKWNANLDAAVPRNAREVAKAVLQAEKFLEGENKKRVHQAAVAKSAFFFTKKARVTPPNPYAPTEGDDFDTLIRKLKNAREDEKRKRNVSDEDLPVKATANDAMALEVSEDVATGNNTLSTTKRLLADSISLSNLPSPPSVPLSPADSGLMIGVSVEEGSSLPHQKKPESSINGDTLSVLQDDVVLVHSNEREARAKAIKKGKEQLEEPERVCASLHLKQPNTTARVDTDEPQNAHAHPAHQDEVVSTLPIDGADVTTAQAGTTLNALGAVTYATFNSNSYRGTVTGVGINKLDNALGETLEIPKRQSTAPKNQKMFTGIAATSTLHSTSMPDPAETTPPSLKNINGPSASQRTTQATVTPSPSERMRTQAIHTIQNHEAEPGRTSSSYIEIVSPEVPVQLQPHALDRASSIDEGTRQAVLTEEQRQRIEQSRMVAMERKMKFLERRRKQRLGQMRQPDLS